MKRLWLAVAAVLLLAPVSAAAQEKWVRGTVSAVAGDTVTVKSMGQDMKFAVTPKTAVVARGAGSAEEAALDEGKTGVKLGEFVKVGDRVELHYTEAAGAMTATRIRAGVAASDAKSAESERGMSTRGTVSAVDGTSVTVMAGGQAMKFAVDGTTRFVGRGLGTKTAAGVKLTPADAVGKGDQVTVLYREGSTHADEVRITRKAP
jgi:hypothetical protein